MGHFPKTEPLESVSVDLLGHLLRTKRGNRFFLVISNVVTKVTRVVPLKHATRLDDAKALESQSVFEYGARQEFL